MDIEVGGMKLRVLNNIETEFEVCEGLNLLGRSCEDTDCNVLDLSPLDLEEKVSRRHAMIERNGDILQIWDLGSLNGTFLNQGEKLQPDRQYTLNSGDKIIVGKTAFVLE